MANRGGTKRRKRKRRAKTTASTIKQELIDSGLQERIAHNATLDIVTSREHMITILSEQFEMTVDEVTELVKDVEPDIWLMREELNKNVGVIK